MALRIFASTGEASGDMLAATLAGAMRVLAPDARFEGIGGERMRAAGFTLTADTRGWGGIGHVEALRRIPLLLGNMLALLVRLRARPPDLLVLVDFGAFNLRLARWLRAAGYRKPILYYFPPGAWFDRPSQARAVARAATPLIPFAHQYEFYRGLGLESAYFGHPLVSLIPPRTAPPVRTDAALVALLPGSRRGEIARHAPRLLEAFARLRARRPGLRALLAAADGEAEVRLRELARQAPSVEIVRGARGALEAADAALVASGTAVLEAALLGVPQVAFYVLPRAQVPLATRLWRRPYVTLPNLVLGREVVPELLQDDATPERMAAQMEAVFDDPEPQVRAAGELRAALGPADALERCAAFAVALAGTS